MVAYKPLQESSAFRLWCKSQDMNIDDYNEIAKDLEKYENDSKWASIIEDSKVFRGVIESIAPSPCFEKDVLVMTDKGYKKIQDIQTDDMVLTHTNKFKKVIKPMKNYAGSILELKFMGSEKIKVTHEHPFYVKRKIDSKIFLNENGKYSAKRQFTEPEWIQAQDLKKGDYVGFAINQNSKLPIWNGVIDNGKGGILLHKINVENLDFWWLVGRYLGDGWCRLQKNKKGHIQGYSIIICCNKNNNEKNDIIRILNNLGYNYTLVEERTTYKIQISNKELYIYLQQFGKYAYGKRITNDILDLPINYLSRFLDGYFSADGCFIEENQVQCFSTVSKELAYGIQHCIHKTYKVPTRLQIRNGGVSVIEGRTVVTKDIYDIRFTKKTNAHTLGFYEDGFIWQPFRTSREIVYEDYVYNMSVEEDQSYTVNNMTVHNCSFLLSNKPISKEVGLIKVGDIICCALDGYNCDVYKFLKND